MRKQYGYFETSVRGDFRFLGRADDTNKNEELEEPNVWRVF